MSTRTGRPQESRAENEECHMEGCRAHPVVAYYVRWTERHQNYNVWKACSDHAKGMLSALSSGYWSGGVQPVELNVTKEVTA